MMKISFIIATLNSGGAERVLVTLANALCKEHEVSIIKFHAGESFYKLENEVKVTS
ncbi:glycosyltransferase family 4 protein, partial [Campylobacter coli]|nr:glycosyltransferase family 4 protein [Campylobacter coli]